MRPLSSLREANADWLATWRRSLILRPLSSPKEANVDWLARLHFVVVLLELDEIRSSERAGDSDVAEWPDVDRHADGFASAITLV